LAAVCGVALWMAAAPCDAHFLWLKTLAEGDQQQAFLFFGENTMDEAYHLPESLKDAKIWHRSADGERAELPAKAWEGGDRIGLGAPLADEPACVLEASEQYGVYGTALLTYWAKHVRANSVEQFNAAGASNELKLDIVPQLEGDSLVLSVLWDGKPLVGAEVSLAVGAGEAVEKTTDDAGRVQLKLEGHGLVGVLTNRQERDAAGKLDEKPYDRRLDYSSLTFTWPMAPASQHGPAKSAEQRAPVPPLPEPLSSFGAVVVNGWLYVYGGHIGTEHDHSAANLSNHFRRVRIDGGGAWEELPMQTPLQGLPLLAHSGMVYRIGGLNARNATTDEDEDLHSTAEFAEFDPATSHWAALPSLPAARSSHNAVVIGDRLYVVGGWTLAGKSPGRWLADALVFDFAVPQAGWQQLEPPPFKRRALAASHWNGKLIVLGGIGEDGKVSNRVDVFDPTTGDWSDGPQLPGTGTAGFGVSAWNLAGRLYASGLSGRVMRLDDSGSAWKEVARMKTGRFFHQLLPGGDGGLLAVGGASSEGHIADIEWVDVRD
jgi:uncharacterized GH25 family protein